MKNIIQKCFIVLLIFVNLAYLPQALIAIKYFIPLVSSINYSYEYNTLGIDNQFLIIRYLKDVIVFILFLLIILDLLKKIRVNRLTFIIISTIGLILAPISILSLNYSNEFNFYMIIAGIRLFIFPITILIFLLEYFDMRLLKVIYITILNLLRFIFIIVFIQSIITIKYFGNLNIAKYRLIGTFSSAGLLGLFGLGAITFIVIYKIKFNKNINIVSKVLVSGFIIYASGTRTAIVIYSMIIFSYIYYLKVNSQQKAKLTNIFYLFCTLFIVFSLSFSEKLADRGDAIEAQFKNGRVTFLIDYLKDINIKELFLGKGIGFGTNTALSMSKSIGFNSTTRVMDGTLNVLITQFGVIIALIFIVLYIIVIMNILNKYIPREFKVVFIITNVILIVICNLLEQFSFQMLFIINNFIILSEFKGGYNAKQ